MTSRSFFIVVLKIMGLFYLLESIYVIPQLITSLYSFSQFGAFPLELIALSIFAVALTAGLYYIIIRFLILHPDYAVDKLHLDKHFAEENFTFNIHRSTAISIALIMFGGYILVDAVPLFIRQLYYYIEEKKQLNSLMGGEGPKIDWLIFYFVKGLIGYLIITNQRFIVNLIERQRKK